MTYLSNDQSVKDSFWSPITSLLSQISKPRRCQTLSDEQWLQMGVMRVLQEVSSGRDFLQCFATEASGLKEVSVSHFFGTLRSKRRLGWLEQIHQKLVESMPGHSEEIWDSLHCLNGFELFAGDGHFHKSSIHEEPIDGKKRSPCHFYTLNLRTRAISPLTLAQCCPKQERKREHDMHALKRQSTQVLRQGTPKGKKVIYAWDSAAIDFQQWYNWKQSAGIYFLCRSKENLKFESKIDLNFEPEAFNQGILKDQMVGTPNSMTYVRKILYQCPQTGNCHEFITNEMTLPPGILAWIYFRRWHIEKTFDTLKNKCYEKRAWAKSDNAKIMQSVFISIAHNLATLFQQYLRAHYNITNQKEIKRAKKRAQQYVQSAKENNRPLCILYSIYTIRSQIDLKFFRWIRTQITKTTSFRCAIEALRRVYQRF